MEKWKAKNAFHFPTAPAAAAGRFSLSAKASDQDAQISSGAEQAAKKTRSPVKRLKNVPQGLKATLILLLLRHD
jgi:hypothetical protein